MTSIYFEGNTVTCVYVTEDCGASFLLTYHPKLKTCTYKKLDSHGMSCKSFSRFLNRCMKCFDVYYGLNGHEHKKKLPKKATRL